jgi:hypothetical protein
VYVVLAPWRDAAMTAGPGALASIFARLANGGGTRCAAACQAVSLVVVSSRESSPLTARFVCQAVNETVLPSHLFPVICTSAGLSARRRGHTRGRGLADQHYCDCPGAPGGPIVQPCPPPAP